MMYLKYEEQSHIGILTINRPQTLNALNTEVLAELDQVLEQLYISSVRCLIVTGAGQKAFVAGADIGEMKSLDYQGAIHFSECGNAVMDKLEHFPVPVIAAINGYALGGGCELALACDIRVASELASFSFPEVTLGIIPGYGGIQRLVRTVGLSKAKEIIMTGSRINAVDALAMGLADRISVPSELMDTCIKLAGQIAANAPVGIRAVKEVANHSVGLTNQQMTQMEVPYFGACFRTADQTNAMTAFLEKRKPDPFTGA